MSDQPASVEMAMAKQLNGIFRTWMRVSQGSDELPPIIWGDCIVHLSHPEFSGNILHTSGVVRIIEHGSFKIVETRNNFYALLGPELDAAEAQGIDPETYVARHRTREKRRDALASAAMNADPDCARCGGAGVYAGGDAALYVCELCCKHNQGWWRLEGGYGENNGRWACKAGCGAIVDRPPPVLQFLPRAVSSRPAAPDRARPARRSA